jgi:hypothetical protein
MLGCLSGRDYAYGGRAFAKAVANDQQARLCAEPDDDKPLFATGMRVVFNDQSVFIQKNSGRFPKRHAMLADIGFVLVFIPFKAIFQSMRPLTALPAGFLFHNKPNDAAPALNSRAASANALTEL